MDDMIYYKNVYCFQVAASQDIPENFIIRVTNYDTVNYWNAYLFETTWMVDEITIGRSKIIYQEIINDNEFANGRFASNKIRNLYLQRAIDRISETLEAKQNNTTYKNLEKIANMAIQHPENLTNEDIIELGKKMMLVLEFFEKMKEHV